MAILVTGGAGYIGSHTCVELQNAGYDVVVLDNLSNSSEKSLDRVKAITGKDVKFYKGDILDRDILNKIFENEQIDSCINFAGLKAVGESVAKPWEYYNNNIAGTLTLVDVMRQHNCKNIIFSSSATVYGDPAEIPITENCPKGQCTNPYGWTKSMLEQILTDIQKADPEWNVILLRYFNPIGAHESGTIGENPNGIPNNLMPYITQVAVGKLKCLGVFGNDYDTPDGTGVRDYIHVVDLALGHVKAIEKLQENPAVNRAYGRMFAYDVPSENSGKSYNANLISYEENQFQWAADSLVAGSIETVMQQENQVLFVQTGNVNVQVGDKITLSINNTKKTVTVAGILSDSPLARVKGTETFFCSEATFSALTGETGYTIIDIQFENNASSEDVNAIKNIFTNGGVIFSDSLSQVQQQRNLYYTFAVLVYGFLSIIVAITIFHIMNTINLGVAAKMKEYGSMRAIGMSNRQLIKMIIAEAGTYAISGVIWGCIIGLPMHWVIYVSLITNIWGTAWSVPFIPLILIIAIVLLTSLLAVKGPAKRLQRMSIVENISAQ